MLRWFIAVAFILTLLGAVLVAKQEAYNPKVAGPSKEGLQVMKRFQLPTGTEATLVAAEPLLANPVAFCFDEQGNIYVAETFRLNAGVTDNRKHMKGKNSWLDDEISCLTVEDRVAMYKKQLGKGFDTITKNHDRVRKLIATKGDGLYDKAFVFADGFNTAATGVGAGVLAQQGKVWFTCIPDLWLLEDNKSANKANARKSLHYGYGVHTAYIGHDMHGLKIGPDGRLYFSIGDRGFHVETEGRVLSNPHSGAVLRCNLDGSGLEIVAVGMRNPQELVFDPFGNLFTGDNNADGGDKARWIHVVEGGDSGWRIGYQEMNKPTKLGPWNSEKIWHTQHDAQPANVVPPMSHIGNGPSGVTIHPGVSQLPERYKDHFFMCDFRGTGGGSGIHAFKLKPHGASFEVLGKPEKFAWAILPTDCDFGPDGGFYWSDWVDGWEMTGKGRMYKIADPKLAKDPAVLEVKKLIGEGMSKRTPAELLKLLEHADMRVRQEAQFALVERGAVKELTAAADKQDKLPRLHAIWGLGMLQRRNPKDATILAALRPLLNARDVDVRCQTLKVLGEAHDLDAYRAMVEQLQSNESRVRYFAAMALGKLGKVDPIPALADMLRDNADKDPYLRHAGVMAFATIGDHKTINSLAKDHSASVRLAALLAMRRLGMADVAQFLNDADPRLVLEAARAINDQPIDAASPQLAALITRTLLPEPLAYRVINANYRLANAAALAKFAGRSDVSEALRVEALDCLLHWDEARVRDRVVGWYRPVAARPTTEIAGVVKANLGSIFTGSTNLRTEGAKLAAKLGIKEVGPILAEIASDTKQPATVRVESLKALATLKDRTLNDAMKLALKDSDPRVRTAGRQLLAKLEPASILAELKTALASNSTLDMQGAFVILGDLKENDVATDLLGVWLDKLLAKQVPPEVQLDLLEAAAKHSSDDIKTKLAKHEGNRSSTDHLAKWTETLHGGDADNGKRIFFERSEVSCLRCHKIQGTGGEVGPDLTGIGAKQKREYLLEALVDPDRQLAQGYETLLLTLLDGKVKSGILKSENKQEVCLMTPEGTLLFVAVADIDSRTRGPSAMPADVMRHLSRKDLRDLLEYLASLR